MLATRLQPSSETGCTGSDVVPVVRGSTGAARRSRDALCRTAPLVLLRYPALLWTAIGGTALLCVAAAAAPMFLSATSSELVMGSVERPHVTRYVAGITYRFGGLPLEPTRFEQDDWFDPGFGGLRDRWSPAIDELDRAFRELAAGSPVLDEPLAAVLGDPVTVSAGGVTGSHLGRLFAEPGAIEHLEPIAGAEGEGVWIPELIAKELAVGPGDTIRLAGARHARRVEVRVDGVYADIYLALPSDGYWLQWQPEFRLPDLDVDLPPPPQPLVADRALVLELTRALGQRTATFSWQAPVRDPAALSLEDVQALDTYQQPLGSLAFARSELGDALRCCGRWGPQIIPDATTTIGSSIDLVVDDAERRMAAVQGPAQVLQIAALAVALVVVAASGAFAMRARRTEATWRYARGTAPTVVALAHAVGALGPALAGGLAGFTVAVVAVRTIGPNGTIDGSAYLEAATGAALAALAAVLVGSVVAGVAYVRLVEPHRHGPSRIVGAVPWELAALWLAYIAFRRLDEGGAFFTDERLGVDRPSLALVAFPFLLLLGLAFLAARLAPLGFGALRRRTARSAPPAYLASRRLAAGGALAVALIGAAGLCLGMFVHSRLVSGSLRATVTSKAHVFVGGDVAAQVLYVTQAPEGLPFPITRVVQVGDGIELPSGRDLDLLAIDPTTFAPAAAPSDACDEGCLRDATRALQARSPAGALPVVLAAAGDLEVAEIVVDGTTLPVDVVARTDAFPGLFSREPLVVVDERALLERLNGTNPLVQGSTELWARGSARRMLDALAEREIPVYLTIAAAEVEDIPAMSATIGTFVVVNALGSVAAALVLVSMLAYVRARHRSQIVSYALSTRMGMTHTEHRRALTLELGLMMGIGFVVGTVVATLAAAVTVPRLDPLGSIPPGPRFLVPWTAIARAAAAVALVAWGGAGIVNRRARTADLAEVMRVAE